MSPLALVLLAQLATHDGKIDGDAIVWTSSLRYAPDCPSRLSFARPLPAATRVERGDDGLRLVRDDGGRPVALRWTGSCTAAELVLRAPLDPRTLSAPLLAGPVLQRLSLAPPARFEPAAALGLEPRVGFRTNAALSDDERAALDRFGGPAPAGALYLTGEVPLEGELRASATTAAVAVWAALAFTVVVAGLFGAHAALERGAARERAEAILKAELDALPPEEA